MDNQQIIFNIVCAILASMSAIIAWFAKKSYADLDKKIEENDADIKILVERTYQLSMTLARNENVSVRLGEMNDQIKELTTAVNELKIGLARRDSQTNERR